MSNVSVFATHAPFLAGLATALLLSPTPSQAGDVSTPIQAKLVRYGSREVVIKIDDKQAKIPVRELHSRRIRDGRLELRLYDKTIFAFKLAETRDQPDSDWIRIRTQSQSTSGSAGDLPSQSDRVIVTNGYDLLDQADALQPILRQFQSRQKQRMHKWFTAMEKLNRSGQRPETVTRSDQFKTRGLADELDVQISQQIRELNQLRASLKRVNRSGTTSAQLTRLRKRIENVNSRLEKIQRLEQQLDANMKDIYRRLQAES